MAALTLRLTKGSELTYAELDGNFSSLNAAKLELDANGTLSLPGSNGYATVSLGAPPVFSNIGSSFPGIILSNNSSGFGFFGASGNSDVRLYANSFYSTSGNDVYGVTGQAAGMYNIFQNSHRWLIAPVGTAGNAITFTQAMTLDASGNLGIGTASPGAQIHAATGAALCAIRVSNTQNPTGFDILVGGTGDPTAYVFNRNNGPIAFGTNNTTRATLDASGNLGLGVTPSAWGDIKPIEFAGSGFFGSNGIGSGVWYGQNCYYDGTNWKAKTTGASAYGTISGGSFLWTNAPSVTAGSNTSPVERMRLDASGNFGVNRTPTVRADFNGALGLASSSVVNAATYTVGVDDAALRFATTNCTVTLPAAASFPGRLLWVSNISANSVTSASSNVCPLGSDTAGTAILAATAGRFALLQSNGVNWKTLMAN